MNNLMELVSGCEVMAKVNDKANSAMEKSRELLGLGFLDLANSLKEKAEIEERTNRLVKYNYICLTKKKIQKFLDNKAAAYNKQHARTEKLRETTMLAFQQYAYALSDIPMPSLNQNHLDNMLTGSYTNGLSYYDSPQSGTPTPPQLGDEVLAAATIHSMSTKQNTVGRFIWTETRIENYKTLPPDNILATLKEHKAREVFDYFTIASVNAIADPLLLGRINGKADRYFVAQWSDDVALDDVI